MIEVNDESGYQPAAQLAEISELATWVLDDLRVHPQSDLSIVLLDEAAMTDLHMQWMDLPGPTDVMSFPMDELRPTAPGAEPQPGMLGDIAICPQVAARQALAAGHNTMEEILLLTTHGILHLLGYDHAEPEEKEEMFALQRRLLLTFLARRPRDPEDPNATIDDIAPTVD